MWLDKRIIKYEESLTRNDMELLEDIKKMSHSVANLNIIEMANQLHTSKSTLLRLAQKLGFKGYSEFKYHFDLNESMKEHVVEGDLRSLIKKDIEQTIKLAEGTNFAPLVTAIKNGRTIYCYGTGSSQKKALEEFARLLLTMDKRVIIVPTSTELPLLLSMMSQEDLLIICSLNGHTSKIHKIIQTVEETGIPIVGISRFSQNYLSEMADLMYYYYCTAFYDPKKSKERVSLVALSILLDWIYRECFIAYLSDDESTN